MEKIIRRNIMLTCLKIFLCTNAFLLIYIIVAYMFEKSIFNAIKDGIINGTNVFLISCGYLFNIGINKEIHLFPLKLVDKKNILRKTMLTLIIFTTSYITLINSFVMYFYKDIYGEMSDLAKILRVVLIFIIFSSFIYYCCYRRYFKIKENGNGILRKVLMVIKYILLCIISCTESGDEMILYILGIIVLILIMPDVCFHLKYHNKMIDYFTDFEKTKNNVSIFQYR